MSQMPVEANVVLTADNRGYDQAMQQSAAQSDAVALSIDKITTKLNDLSKSAGRKILGAGAIDVAAITAGTAAFASYEKQMSQLEAQAAGLSNTMGGSQRTMEQYTRSVTGMREAFGTSTRDAAVLTQQVAKLADGTQPIQKLTNTFAQMSNATGESAAGLSTSVLNLQRVMGTPQADTQKYADQLFSLSAGANTSASALADFSAQLAPTGRLLGISQTDITGFATAFTKAGQDGFQAANVFTKLTTDIAQATQSGSPELAKYANFVGMTVQQFKELEGSDKIIEIVERITDQGPRAITELNKLGLDGMRTVRAITGLAQSGGLGTAIDDARKAFDSGSVQRGSEASMKGITDEFARLGEESKRTAEAFGRFFAPAAEGTISVLEKMMSVARDIMNSPLGQLAGLFAGIAAPLAAIAGTSLLGAAKLATFSAIVQGTRGGFATGYREQRALNPDGTTAMAPGMRPDGRPTSWTQRGFFNAGAGYARLIGAANDGRPNILSRAVGYGLTGAGLAGNLVGQTYSPATQRLPFVPGTGGVSNYLNRTGFVNSPTVGGTMMAPFAALGRTDTGSAMMAGFNNRMMGLSASMTGQVGGVAAFRTRAGGAYTMDDAYRMNQRVDQLSQARTASLSTMSERVQQAGREIDKASPAARALGGLEREAMSASKGLGSFGRGMASVTTMVAAAGMGAARVGGGLASQAFSLVGGNYLLAGGLAAYGGYKMAQAYTNDRDANYNDGVVDFLGPQYSTAGVQAPSPYTPSYGDSGTPITMAQANNITQGDRSRVASGYEYSNENIKNAGSINEAVAGLSQTWDLISNDAEAVNQVALDLTAKFGGGEAQTIISGLQTGGAEELSASARTGLIDEALDAERSGFMDTIMNTRSGSITDDKLGSLFASVASRYNYVSGTEGEEAADRYRVGELESIYQQISDYEQNPRGIGNREEVVGQTNQELANQLFGLELNYDDVKYGRYLTTDNRDLESYIRAQFQNPYGEGNEGYLNPDTGLGQENLTATLSNLGLDESLTGKRAEDAIVNRILNPPTPDENQNGQSVEERVALISPEASDFINSPQVQKLVQFGAEQRPDLVYSTVNSAYDRFARQGLSPTEMMETAGRIRTRVKDDSSDESIVAQGVQQQADQAFQMDLLGMTRPQQFQAQTDMFRSQMSVKPVTAQQTQERNDQTQAYAGVLAEQMEYFRSALLQQDQFDLQQARASEDFYISLDRMEEQYNLSRSRASEDFYLSQRYQEEDYQRQRRYAEFDYNLQRDRAQQNFYRQVRRQERDFNLSRTRQEEDYQHSVRLMIEQTAKQMYDIYERIRVQQTSSADYLLYNANDQIEEMREQAENLDKVRRMGLSDQAIQQLGFNDSSNAQQLARFVSESQEDPETIARMNRAVKQRLAAARELATDESSKEWQEFQRQYRLSRRRAMEDFEKSVARARKDFSIQMNQMEDDFRRSMDRQAESYEIAKDRQAKAFRLTMDRGAEDYARSVDYMTTDFEKSMTRAQENLDLMSRSISGNLKQIFTRASRELRGEVGRQADTTMDSFSELERSLDSTGIDIMKRMAAIFGFDYKAPKGGPSGGGSKSNGDSSGAAPGTPGGPDRRAYAGGVLNATRSVGRDNMQFFSKDHGTLSLAGGEAIMVPEFVDRVGGPAAVRQINDAARYGRPMPSKHTQDGNSFFSGGVMPLQAGALTGNHGSNYYGASFAGDFNGPLDLASPPAAVYAWKKGTVSGTNMSSSSYGNQVTVDHGGEWTRYAHLSSILARVGQQLAQGQILGRVGSTGNSTGAHLHFEIHGGTSAPSFAGGGSGGGGGAPSLWSVLKQDYPELEEKAAGIKLNGGLFEKGFWSKKVNDAAKKALEERGIDPNASMGTPGGPLDLDVPVNLSRNQSIVRQEMLREGFSASQWPALYNLVMKESGFNNLAQNPTSTAFGMFQFLDSTWAGYGVPKTSDPRMQAVAGMNYIRARYGSPGAALAFHNANNWYGDGAIVSGGARTAVIGERGPEMVLPLNDRGAEFIHEIIGRTQVGKEGNATHDQCYTPRISHTQNTYHVDKSTQFTGNITVQANNPGEMLNELKQRQRLLALSQPQLRGTR